MEKLNHFDWSKLQSITLHSEQQLVQAKKLLFMSALDDAGFVDDYPDWISSRQHHDLDN